jgi:hypothetical protein
LKNTPSHVAVRLAPELVARIDALGASLYSAEWRAATRSDSIKALVLVGLSIEEARLAAMVKPKASKKTK